MKLQIPFVKSRGFECGQACVAMIIKYFNPDFEPDFDEFNKIIKHKDGKYTFPPQLAILLDHYKVKSKVYSSDDIKTFKEDFGQFERWYGKDYKKEMKFVDQNGFDFMVNEMRKKDLFILKKINFNELIDLSKKGYLVGMPIDWNTLTNKKGPYAGHFVVISGICNEDVFIHDPDTGPFQKYALEQLERSWEHPAIANDFLVAFGKK